MLDDVCQALFCNLSHLLRFSTIPLSSFFSCVCVCEFQVIADKTSFHSVNQIVILTIWLPAMRIVWYGVRSSEIHLRFNLACFCEHGLNDWAGKLVLIQISYFQIFIITFLAVMYGRLVVQLMMI